MARVGFGLFGYDKSQYTDEGDSEKEERDLMKQERKKIKGQTSHPHLLVTNINS